jgi:SAM-dependent methyltransferase
LIDPENHINSVYSMRFDEQDRLNKVAIWREIVRFLDPLMPSQRPVLDIACDAGYFINQVARAERWATDLRDVRDQLHPSIRFVQADGRSLAEHVPAGHFGTVFMSNYLEHLPSSAAVIEQLGVVHGLLAPGGRVIVLQPNVRLVGGHYWDFIDHHVPLTERSLVEAGESVGLRTLKVITRFLPFTTKSALPQAAALVRLYLSIPLAWRILGKQTLYVAERPPDKESPPSGGSSSSG